MSFTQCSPTCGRMPLPSLSLWPGRQPCRPRLVGDRRGGGPFFKVLVSFFKCHWQPNGWAYRFNCCCQMSVFHFSAQRNLSIMQTHQSRSAIYRLWRSISRAAQSIAQRKHRVGGKIPSLAKVNMNKVAILYRIVRNGIS